MKKNKLLTKEQISEKYKKMRIAAIVGYCLNALLLLLIVLSMVFGSNNASSVSAQNENQSQLVHKNLISPKDFDNYYTLQFKYTDTFELSYDWQRSFALEIYNVDIYNSVPSSAGNLYHTITFDSENYLVFGNGDIVQLKGVFIAYSKRQLDSSDIYYYRLAYIALIAVDDVWYNFVQYYENQNIDNYTYYNYRLANTKIILSTTLYDNIIFSSFYDKVEHTIFTFNKQFNYNAPLSTTIEGVYGSGSFTYTGEDSAYNLYDVGYFISNGQLFNQIKVWYFKTGAIDVYMSNSSGTMGIRRAPSGFYVYAFMEYLYSGSGLVVNSHDLIPFEDSGGYSYYYANSSTWKNDGFRQILFLQSLSDDLTTTINAFNNNNQNSVNGFVGDSNTTNVFTLVGSAFTGLLPILTLELLPSITIGMLLFIPLVAMLIFAIIRIIKK